MLTRSPVGCRSRAPTSSVEWVLTCRTNHRSSDAIYGSLVVMLLAVGIVMVVLGAIYGPLLIVVAGLVFVLAGGQQYRVVLMRTASELSLNQSTNELSWRAVRGHGILNVADIEQVGRSSRPGVYEFRSQNGAKTAFWLSRRDADVRSLFGSLRELNPAIDMAGIYGDSKLWWKGLPAS